MFAQRSFAELTEADETRNPETILFDLDTFKDKGYLTHNFHPYPAKFVPQIPRAVILALTKVGESVLDPFCGSGTTLVEASILKRQSVGFDLNPIAGLVSRVKTTPLTAAQCHEAFYITQLVENEFLSKVNGRFAHLEPTIPDFLNRDHWF